MNASKFIPVAEPDLTSAEVAAAADAVESTWVSSLGPYIDEFEKSFASFCEVPHAACVSNGTVAIHLLLVAAGIQPGDEVIVPSLTFVASVAAIIHAGAHPVFVDCDPDLGTIDPGAVRAAISTKTKAIIAVHLYGHPVDMEPIQTIASENNIYLFEDAAEAHGAKYKGRTVGSIGDAATFSFYGNKMITTGEGGMIVTASAHLNTRIRTLRDHGMDPTRRYWHPEVGFNYRMTNIQAAVGTVQLQRYHEITAKKQRVLDFYNSSKLREFGLTFNQKASWAIPVPWLVCALFQKDCMLDLDSLRANLRDRGIDSRPFFLPIHTMPPYKKYRRVSTAKNHSMEATNQLSSRGINLPSSGNLNEDDLIFIVESLTEILEMEM